MVAQFTLGVVAILLFVAARALERARQPLMIVRGMQILAVLLIGLMVWPFFASLINPTG